MLELVFPYCGQQHQSYICVRSGVAMVPTTPPSGPSLCSYSLSIYGERPANPNLYQYATIGPTGEAGEAEQTTQPFADAEKTIGGVEGAAPRGPACLIPGSRGTRRRLKQPLVQIAQTAEVGSAPFPTAAIRGLSMKNGQKGESCEAKAPV